MKTKYKSFSFMMDPTATLMDFTLDLNLFCRNINSLHSKIQKSRFCKSITS